MTTEERVRKNIVEHLGVEDEKVVREAHIEDDLGADSLDHVELTMAFEEEFGVEITDAEAEGCDLVGDWIDLLDRKLAA